ncbi:hypothetical protein [Virgibacillus necropolis]
MGDGIQHDVLLIVSTVLFITFVLGNNKEHKGNEEDDSTTIIPLV